MNSGRFRLWLTAAFFVLLFVFIARLRHHDSCAVSWRVGTVDGQFNIGEDEVRSAAESAASLWNGAAGREVLRFDNDEGVPINLVYDERQSARDADRDQRQQIEALAAEIDRLKADYASYPSQETADRVNSAVDRHNALVAAYNAKARSDVEQGSFEKVVMRRGKRVVGESAKNISVFEFRDLADLQLVIAHEFGHALGIEHVSDPNAVMSEIHTSGELAGGVQLKSADVQALHQSCGSK